MYDRMRAPHRFWFPSILAIQKSDSKHCPQNSLPAGIHVVASDQRQHPHRTSSFSGHYRFSTPPPPLSDAAVGCSNRGRNASGADWRGFPADDLGFIGFLKAISIFAYTAFYSCELEDLRFDVTVFDQIIEEIGKRHPTPSYRLDQCIGYR